MTDNLKTALAYAKKGFHIFPTKMNKAPLTSDGFKSATTDPHRITLWWERWPSAGIGCVPGLSGHIVLDVDVKNGAGGEASLSALEELNGELPETIADTTPSGGQHYWFSIPGGELGSTNGSLGGGLDTRCMDGYVILPPTVTDSGAYEWITPNGTPLAELPQWLFDAITGVEEERKRTIDNLHIDTTVTNAPRTLLETINQPGFMNETAKLYLDCLGGYAKGNRSDCDFAVASNLAERGLDANEIYQVFMSHPIGRDGKAGGRKPKYLEDTIAVAIAEHGGRNPYLPLEEYLAKHGRSLPAPQPLTAVQVQHLIDESISKQDLVHRAHSAGWRAAIEKMYDGMGANEEAALALWELMGADVTAVASQGLTYDTNSGRAVMPIVSENGQLEDLLYVTFEGKKRGVYGGILAKVEAEGECQAYIPEWPREGQTYKSIVILTCPVQAASVYPTLEPTGRLVVGCPDSCISQELFDRMSQHTDNLLVIRDRTDQRISDEKVEAMKLGWGVKFIHNMTQTLRKYLDMSLNAPDAAMQRLEWEAV